MLPHYDLELTLRGRKNKEKWHLVTTWSAETRGKKVINLEMRRRKDKCKIYKKIIIIKIIRESLTQFQFKADLTANGQNKV